MGTNTKKVLDTILLDKLKLYGELELEEVEANEEMIREYKAIKEKDDLDVFVLHIRLERRFDTHALANTGSNINIIPYRIFKELGREHVKPVSHNVSMLNHSEAEPIGMLKDVLCQLGVIMVLARFLILEMSVDRTIPIIIGRSFLHTRVGIINTLKGTTLTFNGVCHQKFYVAEIQNNGEESDSDDEEEYYLKRDEMVRTFYGPNLISYFDRNDPMECALAIQDSINPFRKIYAWKKAVAFLGSLPAPLLHADRIPKGFRDFVKEVVDGK
ncbi:agenet domain-containing protein [Tanacetum coccineum]